MSLGKRIHALTLEWFNGRYESLVAARKQELLAGLSGDIVEVGAGTGPNLRFYPRDVRLTAVEPNPYMHPYLRLKARERGIALEIRADSAERLPVDDESVDAVVSTLVLCSVRDQAGVLSEVRRVLKPGGKFVFIEHVAAERDTRTRRRQEWISPYWRLLADGCHPDRVTWEAIDRAGFRETDYYRFQLDLPIVGPHLAGIAIK